MSMRIGDIVGAAALVGVAVLVGYALLEDRDPQTITTDTSPFVFDEGSGTVAPTAPST